MNAILVRILDFWGRQPVLITQFVTQAIVLLVAFGVPVTDAQRAGLGWPSAAVDRACLQRVPAALAGALARSAARAARGDERSAGRAGALHHVGSLPVGTGVAGAACPARIAVTVAGL